MQGTQRAESGMYTEYMSILSTHKINACNAAIRAKNKFFIATRHTASFDAPPALAAVLAHAQQIPYQMF